MESSKENEVLPVKDQIELFRNGDGHSISCLKYSDDTFTLPSWYDEKKFKRGQKYIQNNIMAQFTCTLSGLLSVLSIPSILNILLNTQRSSTILTAYRRYVSTIFHVWSWYMDDLKPGSESWKSLIAVRSRHFRTSTITNAKGQGFISQLDMAYTQFGFFGFGLLMPHKLGMMTGSKEDIEGYIHFWRTIGYMIGITDRYNIGRSSIEETKEVCEFIHKEVYCFYLKYPPRYFFFMIQSLLKAMWYFSPALSPGSYLYFTYWLAGLEDYPFDFNNETYMIKLFKDPDQNSIHFNNNSIGNGTDKTVVIASKELGWYNKYLLRLMIIVHKNWLTNPIGRLYMNSQIHLTIFLLKYFPFLNFWYFGWKYSFVNMFEEDIAVHAEPKPNEEMFALIQY